MRNHRKRLCLDIAPLLVEPSSSEPIPISIVTPTQPLAPHRVQKDFENTSPTIHFQDKKNRPTTLFDNQYTLRSIAPITPGAHARVEEETLISPGGNSSIQLVGKHGTTPVKKEIKMFQLITSNVESGKKALLQPVFSEVYPYKHSLHLPLMPGGNLKKQQEYLYNKLQDPNQQAIVLAWFYKQIISLLETLNHLHTATFTIEMYQYKGVVHGDIKPDNILINSEGDLILADLGCAYPLSEPAKQFGSLRYSAPEIFANEYFTKKAIKGIEKSDVWSLGITLYYLINEKLPYFYEIESKKTFFKKNIPDYFFSQKNTNLFFQSDLDGHFYRKNWGERYASSTIAKQANEAMTRLNSITLSKLFTLNTLYDLCLVMLLPIEQRPSAAQLLGKIVKFSLPYCSSYTYNKFITDLLAQSSFNQSSKDSASPSIPLL
jgi:serine/threonine protein kinase